MSGRSGAGAQIVFFAALKPQGSAINPSTDFG